jgi:hypothetical protein
MNGTNVTHGELHAERTERSLRAFAGGGSLVEAIGGIAAIVLAILGLAGSMQNDMMAIATIVLGASLILEGGAIASSFRRALFSLEGESAGAADLGGAATVEFLAGFTGIVLGVLALLGIGNLSYFISISAIVFGASLLLSSSAVARLNTFWSSSSYLNEGSRTIAQTSSEAGAGGQMLIGLAAVVLGVLALLGINPVVLNLVSLLALGVSVLLSGTAFSAHSMIRTKRV